MAGKIRLGELLVRAGVLDELKLKAALAEQQRWGGRLGRILVDMNFVSEDLLTKALSKQLGFPRATFAEVNIPPAVLAQVPADFARSNACCPEHYDPARNLLTVAMADPTNVPVADELRFKTGLRVEATIAGEVQISVAIDKLYGNRSGGYPASVEAIDLPPASAPADPARAHDPAYVSAMAASGLPVEPTRPATGGWPSSPPVLTGSPSPLGPPVTGSLGPSTTGPLASRASTGPLNNPLHSTGPLELNLMSGSADVAPRSANGHAAGPFGSSQPMPASSLGNSAPSPAPQASDRADGVARRLEAAQRQQHRAVQVMLDLLIEKGVFTRDEFAQLINRRGR